MDHFIDDLPMKLMFYHGIPWLCGFTVVQSETDFQNPLGASVSALKNPNRFPALEYQTQASPF